MLIIAHIEAPLGDDIRVRNDRLSSDRVNEADYVIEMNGTAPHYGQFPDSKCDYDYEVYE